LTFLSATLESQKGNFDLANEHLDQLLEKNRNDAEVIMKKAENAFMCEKFYEAEELFFRALQCNKKFADFKT
jgi:Flp pilus assembly protein TadD